MKEKLDNLLGFDTKQYIDQAGHFLWSFIALIPIKV